MKVLVYGAGVIGGLLCHALCEAGNDVTLIARGAWAETLRQNGLRIHHYIQRRDTVDRPRILEGPGNESYDVAFAVMQYKQMEAILPDLAALNCPLVVLVGNNLSPVEMERYITEHAPTPKTVLFGFGSTAGSREDGQRLNAVHTGEGRLTVGGLHAEASPAHRALLEGLFPKKFSLAWCDNMDAWLKYHAAFIVPTVYVCYATGCDLRKAARAQRKLLLAGAEEAYKLLMALGYPVRPVGDERSFRGGMRLMMEVVIYLMAKTKIGALCTTEHCRHAVGEMEDLDTAFLSLRAQKPDFPMPSFDALRAAMPPWEELRRTYGGAK